MEIDLQTNSITIHSSPGELRSYQKRQLAYWGFHMVAGQGHIFVYSGEDTENLISQVMSYFQKEETQVVLSEAAQAILKRKQERIDWILEKKTLGSNYKNGVFELDVFNSFCRQSASFPRVFKNHQLKAAFHHYLVRNSADFSVPGSGKTSTELLVYEMMRNQGEVNCLFVVGPPSCFTAWKREFELTLGRIPKLKILTGIPKETRIGSYYNYFDQTELFLISFQSFANDFQHIKSFFANPRMHVFFVVDEAHYIKLLDGTWSKAVLEVGPEATCIQILSGTPCPHGYSDLFNLFDLLFGKNVIITESNKIRINSLEVNKNYREAGILVQTCVDPFFYRVRKKDLGLTEPIFHPPVLVEMNKHERDIYNVVLKRISQLAMFDEEKNLRNLMELKRGRIIRLRQLTSYCKLLLSAIDDYDENLGDADLGNLIVNYDQFEVPGKLPKLLELISSIRLCDRKVVIWSNFIETINFLEKQIRSTGVGCEHLYGNVPINDDQLRNIKTREKVIDEFLSMDSPVDVLVANPAACAESISLHKTCHHAIYYDLSYNAGQYLQSLDRIHRVGGSENTFAHYYHLFYSSTIDEDIFENLRIKRDKMVQVIESDSDIYDMETNQFLYSEDDLQAYERLFTK